MTLRHLQIYVTVCELGTLTAAGRKLYISQPAISLAISEMETHYGVKLFDRISNRLHITDVGRQVQQYAQHIISLYDEMEHNITDVDAFGVLRIGSSITIANCLLPDFILELKKTHPQTDVKVVVQNSELIEKSILNNKIDFGLIEGTVHSEYLRAEEFMEDKMVFIIPIGHALAKKKSIAITELEGENVLLREPGSAGREIFDGLVDTYSLSVNHVWQSTSTQAIIGAVKKGLGISILPYMLVKEFVEKGEISMFELQDIPLMRIFSVVHHKNKYLSNSALDFIEICRKSIW